MSRDRSWEWIEQQARRRSEKPIEEQHHPDKNMNDREGAEIRLLYTLPACTNSFVSDSSGLPKLSRFLDTQSPGLTMTRGDETLPLSNRFTCTAEEEKAR
eukprot:757255-Hanusia_phi.AAC.2